MPNIDLSILNQRQTPAFFADTLANRPAPSFVGRIFISTDTLDLYRDTGTAWLLLSPSSTGTITGSGAAGQVTYFSAASSITGSNDLFWDNVNGHFGIGTNVPGTPLDIHHDQSTLVQLNQTTATNDTRIAFQNSGTALWRIGNFYNSGANDWGIFDVVGAIQPLRIKKTTGQAILISDISVNSVNIGRGKNSIISNTIVGTSVLNNCTTGLQNTGFGFSSLSSLTTANQNTAIGDNVLRSLITGDGNTGIGHAAFYTMNGGSNNIGIGYDVMYNSITGQDNIAIGRSSFYTLNATNNNIAIGNGSGVFINSGANLTSATDSIFIGRDARPSANANTNEIVIGSISRGSGSNTVTIGNSSITNNYFNGIINNTSDIISSGNLQLNSGALIYTNKTVTTTNRAVTIRKTAGFDGSNTTPTILQIDVPAKEYFIVIEALITKTRAGGTLQDVGTSEVQKIWFSIGRNGSGFDVILNNNLATQGWNATSTSAGGSCNMNSISATISRSGVEPNTATQGVKLTIDITGSTSNYNGASAIFNINIIGESTNLTIN